MCVLKEPLQFLVAEKEALAADADPKVPRIVADRTFFAVLVCVLHEGVTVFRRKIFVSAVRRVFNALSWVVCTRAVICLPKSDRILESRQRIS